MLRKIKQVFKRDDHKDKGIFSESVLQTSCYDELQKNGWCDIVEDKPDDLKKWITISFRKTMKI